MTIKVDRISPNTISKNPDEAAAIMIVIEFPVLPVLTGVEEIIFEI